MAKNKTKAILEAKHMFDTQLPPLGITLSALKCRHTNAIDIFRGSGATRKQSFIGIVHISNIWENWWECNQGTIICFLLVFGLQSLHYLRGFRYFQFEIGRRSITCSQKLACFFYSLFVGLLVPSR